MRKYIDAEAFKRRILSYGTVHEGDRIPIPYYKHYFAEAYVAILRWVCEEVDDTPAADVQKIVRCGECKHLMQDGRCYEFADDNIKPSASDYGSYGERKNE